MDPQKRTLIITGIVLFVILLIIFGTIFFLIRSFSQRSNSSQTNNNNKSIFPIQTIASSNPFPNLTVPSNNSTASPQPSANPSANNQTQNQTASGSTKVYQGSGFAVKYPKDWGLLTCNNSSNFELDPTNPQDQLGVACNRAQKPITVLVGQNSCVGGNIVTLGNIQVRKIVNNSFATAGGSGIEYHWCTQTSPALDITHRVGSGTAFSTQDYATQVEQIISSISFGQGS
jgi:hypothetical protein